LVSIYRRAADWRTFDGENAHVGFVTVADLPYMRLAAAARDANLSVLRELHASRAAMRVVSGQFALIELVIVAGFGGPSSAPSRQICCA